MINIVKNESEAESEFTDAQDLGQSSFSEIVQSPADQSFGQTGDLKHIDNINLFLDDELVNFKNKD